MFGRKNDIHEVTIESENLAMPEIHIGEHAQHTKCEMTVLDAIAKRCSVRRFSDAEISEADLRAILEAGMSGPSATNARDWSFVVVRDRNRLIEMAKVNGASANPLMGAAVGILVCGDYEKAFSLFKDFWIIDGAIAAQNMILAAKGLGIGSVWLGTWPDEEKVNGQRKLFGLPDGQIPHSVIAFGYPAEEANADQTKQLWDESVVHYEQW